MKAYHLEKPAFDKIMDISQVGITITRKIIAKISKISGQPIANIYILPLSYQFLFFNAGQSENANSSSNASGPNAGIHTNTDQFGLKPARFKILNAGYKVITTINR